MTSLRSKFKGLLRRQRGKADDRPRGGDSVSSVTLASDTTALILAAEPDVMVASPSPEQTGLSVQQSPENPPATPATPCVQPAASDEMAVSPSPEQIGLSVQQSLETPPTTPAVPSAQPAASDATSRIQIDDIDPWTRAFALLQEREPELATDYNKHLASLQDHTATSVDLSAPQSVQSIIKQLLEDRDKKQWQVTLLGNDIKIREQVEKLVKFLLWSNTMIKNALSAQPYAALAWSGVSVLLPLLTSSTTKTEAMLKGFNSIVDLQVYWDICERTYIKSDHRQHYQALVQPLAKFYSYIVEYQARVICHLSKTKLSRAWQNVAGWDDWNMATEIEKLSQDCSGYIDHLNREEIREHWHRQLQEMQQSERILTEIRETVKGIENQSRGIYEDQRETALLHDLASDYKSYKDFNPQKVEGTCEWFFNDDRFRTWRDSNTSRLLWVSAGPGCGKSVLSRALIDEHRLSTKVTTSTICYFFFKDGEEGRMQGSNALCAILHQLFTEDSTESLIKSALSSHKNHGGKLKQNLSELWDILIKCTSSIDTGEVICILDALDECEEKSRVDLVRKLKQFYGGQRNQCEPSKLKFLITSRPYDRLETAFDQFPATKYHRVDGDDKSADISGEINLVIDERVREVASKFADNDRRRLSKRLKSMKNRTYLWLHIIFNIIEDSPSYYNKSSNIDEDLLSNIPSEVSEAYEKILSKSQRPDCTRLLLQIILAAARPLTLQEANIALTLAWENKRFPSHAEMESDLWPESVFKSTVKNLCGLFISVYDSKLYFIHQTAREFLTHPTQQGTWEGRFDIPSSHSKISLACLHYLLLPDLPSEGHNPRYDRTPPTDREYPFLNYAAHHWDLHYNSQEDVIANRSRNDARLLCNVEASVWATMRDFHLLGWTDLALASNLGLKQVVEDMLIKEKINVNVRGRVTTLQAASDGGHKEVVQLLLDKGADINAGGGIFGTALQLASEGGHKEIVQLLLDKGADINAAGDISRTALKAASRRGHKEIVQLLLDKGADINAGGGKSGTALKAASERGHKEIVQLLLDNGADVNARDRFETALAAASREGHEEIIQLLLDNGADINAGEALQAASEGGYKEIVQLLLDNGANVNASDGLETALAAASGEGHKEIVQLLLDKGADINAAGDISGTALQAASDGGYKEVVQLLLDNGALMDQEISDSVRTRNWTQDRPKIAG